MTSVAVQSSHEPSDAELIRLTREGDAEAYGVLFARHADAATMLASRLTSGTSVAADDVVADAFVGVLAAIRSGRGPEESFRAYLYTAVRNGAAALRERESRAIAVEDPSLYEKPEPTPDPAVTAFESEVVQRAFAALPERWQAVLWYSEVEAMKPAEIAPLLGVSPNGVSALLLRAREGLRERYIVEHLGALDGARPACAWTAERLGAHVRDTLSRRDRRKVTGHLGDCDDCRAMAAEASEVNRGLHLVVVPFLLGGAGAAWLASRRAMQASPATSVTAAAHGPRVAGKAGAIAGLATAGVVVVAMVALAVTGVLSGGGSAPGETDAPVVLPETDETATGETPDDDASTEPPTASDDQPGVIPTDPAPRTEVPERPVVVPNPGDTGEPPLDPVTELPIVQTALTGVLTVLDADHPNLTLAGTVQSAVITWVTEQVAGSELVIMQTPTGEFALPYATLATRTLDDGTVQYIGTADASTMVSTIGDGQWAIAPGFEVIDWRLDILTEGAEVAGVQLDGTLELAAGDELSIPLVAPGSGIAYVTTYDGTRPQTTVVDGVLWIRADTATLVKQILVVFD